MVPPGGCPGLGRHVGNAGRAAVPREPPRLRAHAVGERSGAGRRARRLRGSRQGRVRPARVAGVQGARRIVGHSARRLGAHGIRHGPRLTSSCRCLVGPAAGDRDRRQPRPGRGAHGPSAGTRGHCFRACRDDGPGRRRHRDRRSRRRAHRRRLRLRRCDRSQVRGRGARAGAGPGHRLGRIRTGPGLDRRGLRHDVRGDRPPARSARQTSSRSLSESARWLRPL